jgi:hypothetical protein
VWSGTCNEEPKGPIYITKDRHLWMTFTTNNVYYVY